MPGLEKRWKVLNELIDWCTEELSQSQMVISSDNFWVGYASALGAVLSTCERLSEEIDD